MNLAERAEALRAMLAAEPRFGAEIAWPDETASTNDLCHSAAAPGFAALAERQTAGRGQRGRSWEAPAGLGVLLSAVAPAAAFADDAFLSALAAVGVADALAAAGLPCRLKWPNDVLVGGRKIAGALVERRRVAVLGVGINVLQTALDLPPEPRWPATSILIETGTRFDRAALAADVLSAWDRRWRHAEARGPEQLHAGWQRLAWPDLHAASIATLSDGSEVAGELLSLRLDRGVGLRMAEGDLHLPPERVAGVRPRALPDAKE